MNSLIQRILEKVYPVGLPGVHTDNVGSPAVTWNDPRSIVGPAVWSQVQNLFYIELTQQVSDFVDKK